MGEINCSIHKLRIRMPSTCCGWHSYIFTTPRSGFQSLLKSTTMRLVMRVSTVLIQCEVLETYPATCPFLSFCTDSLNLERPTTVGSRRSFPASIVSTCLILYYALFVPRRAKSMVSSTSAIPATSVPLID